MLETIADGVVLLDEDDRVLFWNDAAETITGVPRPTCSAGRRRTCFRGTPRTSPRWRSTGAAVDRPGRLRRPRALAVVLGRAIRRGTVYAFRDLTEERGLEQMRSDFVATVSHELRTPLAAIYGAAVTLRRRDLELDDEMRERLLDVVAEESDRLAQIVNDVLLASHLDSGQLHLNIQTVDAVAADEPRRRRRACAPARGDHARASMRRRSSA